MRPPSRFLSAAQAAEALGVTLPTLYAYTSRGQLQSEPVPGRPREHRYFREDVERLRQRKEWRRDPAKAAARGLHWGAPMLASAITLIQDGKLYYRGRDAVKLAETASLEQTAVLLWGGDFSAAERLFGQPGPLPARQLARLAGNTRDPLVRIQMALPLAGAVDLASYDLRAPALQATGARIVRLLAAVVAGNHAAAPIHRILQQAWAPSRPAAGEAIRTALVLCADHELNVSAFTARCAASAGAGPYDVIAAGMAALKGTRHGGESARAAALLDEAAGPQGARAAIARRLRNGDRVPGFGHPLYPAGDPRAVLLLRWAAEGPDKKAWAISRAMARAAAALLQEQPNLDFGLTALARAHRLPDYAPLVLFALGRTTGWMAHAMEQYADGELIRPRARYTGVSV